MATAQANLTPSTNTAPAVVSIPALELSGAQWVARFPTSTSVEDLIEPFRSNLKKFIEAIKNAGANVVVSATYRPTERAYLMHYCSKISKGAIQPQNVPPMAGVNIKWAHSTLQQSISAATAMANGYGIVYPPALASRHTQRRAVDMTVSGIVGKSIKNAANALVLVQNMATLHQVGASYAVIKLVSDPPHWFDDGH